MAYDREIDSEDIADGAILREDLADGAVGEVGLLAGQPLATAVPEGWMYLATDVDGGTLYVSDGTTWNAAGSTGVGTFLMLDASNGPVYGTLVLSAVPDSAIASGTIVSELASVNNDSFDAHVVGDTSPRVVVRPSGIFFGDGTSVDASVIRTGFNELTVNGSVFASFLHAVTGVWSLGAVIAEAGGSEQTVLGPAGPSSQSGILFGSAGDAVLYRSAAATLRTDATLEGVLNITSRVGVASQTRIGNVGPGSQAGITFGSAGVDTLYRTGAGDLRLSAALTVDSTLTVSGTAVLNGNITSNNANASQTAIGALGPSSQAGIIFGLPPFSANLYENGGNTLNTDDNLTAGENITARRGLSDSVLIGSVGVGTGGILFGSAGDTRLFRSTADTLRTDDNLIVDLNLTVSGNTILGNAVTDTIGLYGKTPVVQAAAITAPNAAPVAYSQADLQTVVDAVNALRVAVSNVGIIA